MASNVENAARSSPIQLPSKVSVTSTIISTTFTNEYQYQALDETVDGIRLLVLHQKTEADDHIRCDLVHTTFRDKPVYEALSYTWGTDLPTQLIYIDGMQYYVRKNLYDALCGLQPKDSSRNLWIDAVCIDQANLRERTYQVGIMDFIYTRASTVLVWLGAKIQYCKATDAKMFLDYRYPEFNAWKLAICEHPYWRRLWIIQEICLARRITVCIGTDTKSWGDFVRLLLQGQEENLEGAYLIERLNEKRLGRHSDSNRLEILLEHFEYALCQERRDKIYGLLGLTHDSAVDSIYADYAKGWYEVYCDVIKFFIKKRLFTAGSTNEFDRSMRLVRFSQLLNRLLATSYLHQNFICNPRTLVTIQGAFVSTVTHIGPTYDDIISSSLSNKKWISSFANHECRPQDVTTRREANEAYMETLLAMEPDYVAKIHNVYPNDRQHILWSRATATSAKWMGTSSQWTHQNLGVHGSSSFTDTSTTEGPVVRSPEPRMFLGSNFHLGLAPSDTQVGDVICQFWECDSVAILRSEGHILRVVGRADLARDSSMWHLQSTYKNWNSIPDTAPQIIIQMDIDVLSFLTC